MPLNDFRSVCMPYCLQKQPDGKYLVLNRGYKPFGFKTSDHVKYEDYPICLQLKGIGPATAAKLSYKGSDDVNAIFLYNDGWIPTRVSKSGL